GLRGRDICRQSSLRPRQRRDISLDRLLDDPRVGAYVGSCVWLAAQFRWGRRVSFHSAPDDLPDFPSAPFGPSACVSLALRNLFLKRALPPPAAVSPAPVFAH